MLQKMKKDTFYKTVFFVVFVLFSNINSSFGQYNFKNSDPFLYNKSEINWGFQFKTGNEREETRTDLWRKSEKLDTRNVTFRFENRFWNFDEYKQERFNFSAEAGPFWGNGNWIDSSATANTNADETVAGLRTAAEAGYALRYYYNRKNYTLIQINGWARYDIYRQNSTGISIDSNDVITGIDEKTSETKFRYSVDCRAGWGIGRLNPMNHFMVADYLLKKYHSERNYSQAEITQLAQEISRIKNQRNLTTGHKADAEIEEVQEYLNKKMFLIRNESISEAWETGEFNPRFNGNRVEFGPFFKYYNREPDFIYGGYVLYDNAKYCNEKWNRNFSAGANYNAYKKQDWVLAELNIGWSYFSNLRSQFDFGFKYVPGIAINGTSETGKVNNGFIPYLGYFTQINAKNRIDINISYRFSDDEKLMLSGPEFSLSVYRSRY
jgi:hypothetical protein